MSSQIYFLRVLRVGAVVVVGGVRALVAARRPLTGARPLPPLHFWLVLLKITDNFSR